MILPRMTIVILAASMALTACAKRNEDGQVTLSRIQKTGDGPDEFSIMPGKPLQTPESFSALPAPNPGGANRTDQNPKADGIAALGGNPAALNAGVSSADASLMQHSARYGTQAGIRTQLQIEDNEVRRRHGRVNIFNIGKTDDYTDAYKRQWLDADREQQRLRALGIKTPSAPPAE